MLRLWKKVLPNPCKRNQCLPFALASAGNNVKRTAGFERGGRVNACYVTSSSCPLIFNYLAMGLTKAPETYLRGIGVERVLYVMRIDPDHVNELAMRLIHDAEQHSV